ncbi:hypothetical protein M8J76_003846 [Diaphorina citri]|nr:hypothetical protein M8J76_003846 [Diaphorina citri]
MHEKHHQGRSYYLNRAPSKRSKLRPILIAIGFILLILVAITFLYVILTGEAPQVVPHYRELNPPDVDAPLPPSAAKLRLFQSGAVCSDAPVCAQIGREILAIKGATVIDSTVASLLCQTVYGPHSTGLGGGFVLTYYRRQDRTTFVLNARESAPLNATAKMCRDNPRDCRYGAKAVAVPGTLLGLHTVWQRWGKLPWDILVQPAVQLCVNGFNMSAQLAYATQMAGEDLAKDASLREIFFTPDSGSALGAGSWVKPSPKLCDTLKTIAQKGVFEFYEGVLGDDFVLDVREMGGNLTRNDLKKYRVEWSDVSVTQLYSGHTLYAPPAPHSGDLLIYAMNILNHAQMNNRDDNSTLLSLHRLLETFKYVEAQRQSLGDPHVDAVKELLANLRSRTFADLTRANISDTTVAADDNEPYRDHMTEIQDGGYSHFSLLAPDGDAVSVTSSLGSYFGAKVLSQRTGIVLNSALGDFSPPPDSDDPASSVPNLPGPGKRPLSPASPTIVLNSAGDVQLVLGGSGGEKIVSTLAQVMVKYLWFNQGLKSSMDDPRIYSRLKPRQVLYEYGFLKKYIQDLYRFGHTTSRLEGKYSTGLCSVGRARDNRVEAIADWRTGGDVFGL